MPRGPQQPLRDALLLRKFTLYIPAAFRYSGQQCGAHAPVRRPFPATTPHYAPAARPSLHLAVATANEFSHICRLCCCRAKISETVNKLTHKSGTEANTTGTSGYDNTGTTGTGVGHHGHHSHGTGTTGGLESGSTGATAA